MQHTHIMIEKIALTQLKRAVVFIKTITDKHMRKGLIPLQHRSVKVKYHQR